MLFRESNTVLDCGFHTVDPALQVLDSGFHSFCGFPDSLICIPDSKGQDSIFHSRNLLDSGFFFSGTWIPDFIRLWDPGFLDLYFRFPRQGFHISQQKFAGFRIPRAKISRIRESGFPHMGQVLLVASLRVCRGLVPKEAARREIIVIHLITCLIFPL